MQVQPYLFFDGRCDEAIEFYKKMLGANVGTKRLLVELDRLIAAAIEEQVGLHLHNSSPFRFRLLTIRLIST